MLIHLFLCLGGHWRKTHHTRWLTRILGYGVTADWRRTTQVPSTRGTREKWLGGTRYTKEEANEGTYHFLPSFSVGHHFLMVCFKYFVSSHLPLHISLARIYPCILVEVSLRTCWHYWAHMMSCFSRDILRSWFKLHSFYGNNQNRALSLACCHITDYFYHVCILCVHQNVDTTRFEYVQFDMKQ